VRTTTVLRVLAVGAPVAFTACWLVVGVLTPGYDQTRLTISGLAEQGQPHRAWMTAGFVLQGLGQLAGAALALRRPRERWVSAALTLGGLGTIAVALVPLPGATGPVWLATGHSLAATAAFVGLHLAALAGLASSRVPRGLRVAAALALVVALPNLAWFLAHLSSGGGWYGGSEKAFVTVLLAWCAALACGREPGAAGGRPARLG
jgi:hypothetical membrane protein